MAQGFRRDQGIIARDAERRSGIDRSAVFTAINVTGCGQAIRNAASVLISFPIRHMAKEQFFHPESADLLRTLDEAAHRSGVSRGQAFDDFLHMLVCSLSGGRMEQQYLEVVKRHSHGKPGKRGCDSLAELFGRTVAAMEETRDEMKDILGDLFQGSITYGEAGQFFSPAPVCRMMARMMVSDVPEEEQHETKRVCDPASGSGRMLLAVAEIQPHWTFVGKDIDLRCVRMTAINLALRNLPR